MATLLAAMLLSAGSAAAEGDGSRSVGTTIDDSVITTKVKAELVDQDSIEATDIDVDTRSGVVQLTGVVESEDDAALAEQVAAKIEGVRMVQNDLEVR